MWLQKAQSALRFFWSRRPKTKKQWGLCFIAALVVGTLYGVYLWVTLPDVSDPRALIASQSSVILDREGTELYRLFTDEDRTYIDGSKIPKSMKHAIIAIEDQRFYERGCLDMRAIARAVFKLGRAGGGSTLTRQLARNALDLQNENRYQRKLKELILGCMLESKMSKEELLELYLNWIPFGRNAYGLEQASRTYFGHTARDLTLAQSSLLASLPQRPTYFSPYGRHVHTEVDPHIEEAILEGEITAASHIDPYSMTIGLLGSTVGTGSTTVYIGGRTDQVLKNMLDQGFITETERDIALKELQTLTFESAREDIRAPHFVLWIREQVENLFAGTAEEGLLEQGGLTVETTLDWEIQQIADETVAHYRDALLETYEAHNIALLSVDPHTREILAYVGNMDYGDTEHGGKIDMIRSPRQPGSSFKPFVYAAAFQEGYSPASPIYDVQTIIGEDEPQNFDGEFHGILTMRKALGSSRNIPAAKAFFLGGGEEAVLSLVERFGIPTPKAFKKKMVEQDEDFGYGWPLALGAAEVPLLEMVQGYSTLAAGGTYAPLQSITRITDRHGNLLYEAQRYDPEEVLDKRIAYLLTSVLSDENARPEGFWRKQLSIPQVQTASKTGTSNKCFKWEDRELSEEEQIAFDLRVENAEEGEEIEHPQICTDRRPDNAWLLGYTPHFVTGVWVGNANSSEMSPKSGGLNTASPVWRDYMTRVHRTLEEKTREFPVPDGLITPLISALSGELPTECTPLDYRRPDVFLVERMPTLSDTSCTPAVIDRVTGLLASDGCPQDAQEEGNFLKAKALLPDRFPEWQDGVDVWAQEQMGLWNATPDHSGSILPLPVLPTDVCDPSLTPGRLEKPTLHIDFPSKGSEVSHSAFAVLVSYTVGSEVRDIQFMLDGKKARSEKRGDGAYVVVPPRSVGKTGFHLLEATLIDEYYNTAKSQVQVRFGQDKRKPSVRFVAPLDGFAVDSGEEVRFRAQASDNEGGIKYVQFFLHDTLLTTKPTDPYVFPYTLDLPSGTYEFTAKATDLAGNTEEDTVRVIVR